MAKLMRNHESIIFQIYSDKQLDLLIEETRVLVHGENYNILAAMSQIMLYPLHLVLLMVEMELPILVETRRTDCIGNCKSNYHTDTTIITSAL